MYRLKRSLQLSGFFSSNRAGDSRGLIIFLFGNNLINLFIKFIIQMISKSVAMLRAILLCKLITLVSCSFYSYSACNSTSYLNTANLQCNQCSNNQIANTYQIIPINCQCAIGYVVANNNTCSQINSNTCGTNTTYYPLYTITGDVSSTVSTAAACSSCANTAYTNQY
jgi:hypothetical protein